MQEIIVSDMRENGQDELKELQNTQYNLLMLQQKRNELEQLKNLLQAALESGDMETLGQLSEMIQDLPEVSDMSDTQPMTENNDEMLYLKQASQKSHLANLEIEQDQLQKSAEEQREVLAQKRGKLQELQLQLSNIKADAPWASTETQVVTLVNPDGLDRKVSNITLIDDSFDDNDEDLDEQMQENEEYLQNQERSLGELRQRIEMLQQLKKELENTQAADEENGAKESSQGNVEDSDETLEALLRKLASASIDDIKAADFTTASKQVIDISEFTEEDDNQPIAQKFDDENADMKIRESIFQATQHVKDLEVAIASTNNPEEKKVFMELHAKLTRQLSELVEVETKLNYYRSIIQSNQDEEFVIRQVSEVSNSEAAAVNMPPAALAPKRAVDEPHLIHQTQIESLVKTKRSVSNAWSEASKSTHFYGGSESLVQRRMDAGESRRPTSSMAGEGSWQSEASVAKSKRLFDSMKADIYRHTASLITTFENEPYFLLSLLKKIKKIDSTYLKQKLLVTLDNLLEEEDLDAQSIESLKGSFVSSNIPDVMNTNWEITIKSQISSFLMNMARDSANQILNAFQLSKLNHFVLSLVHDMLFATININSKVLESLQDRLTILIDLFKPALDEKTLVFQGRRLMSVQAEILAIIFQEIHNVCQEWSGFMDSYRWETKSSV